MKSVAGRAGKAVSFITLPEEQGARLPQADCDRIDCTSRSRHRFNEQLYAAYDEAVIASKSSNGSTSELRGRSAAPHPGVDRERRTITSSTGSNAEPVAQTGLPGCSCWRAVFPRIVQDQQKREWRPLRGAALPNDLRGQTVLLIGVGAIGTNFAGYARAFGLKVIGVRRSPRNQTIRWTRCTHPRGCPNCSPCRLDRHCMPADEGNAQPDRCRRVKRMRKGARLINIARGEVVDESALIGRFEAGISPALTRRVTQEPLPADPPFWDLPNVIVSPHNAAASTGNEKRSAEMFIANFGHWLRGEPMFNVQKMTQ